MPDDNQFKKVAEIVRADESEDTSFPPHPEREIPRTQR